MSALSWGRLPLQGPAAVLRQDWRFQALPEVPKGSSLLPWGAGRSYGDSCVNSGANHLHTAQLDRFVAFDVDNGVLRCESGVTLETILAVTVPAGWFLPVVPGTRFVTLGGAVANDIHGKNHHVAGSFGCHVRSLELLRSDGQRVRCSASENAELFAATIGGLGLTGLITEVELQLLRVQGNRMLVEDQPFADLSEFIALSEASAEWPYTVSWVDSFARGARAGRGIFSRARHVAGESPAPGSRPAIPFAAPFSLVNRYSVNLFNRVYAQAGSRRQGARHEHYERFFFPLDAIGHWNRIYGRHGFYQYQCVVPGDGAQDAVQALLDAIDSSAEGSFLAVLKQFGERQSPGLLSFPRPGLTLALDFPNRGEKTRRLLCALDEIVSANGGALYPAKDARMSARMFSESFPNLDQFRQHIDPAFSSAFWRRVQPL